MQFALKAVIGKICAVYLNCVLGFVCLSGVRPARPGSSNYTHYWSYDMLRRNMHKWSLVAAVAIAGVALSARSSQAHFHGGWGSSGGGWGSSGGSWGSSGGYYGWSGSSGGWWGSSGGWG